jgi:hypothetical protein
MTVKTKVKTTSKDVAEIRCQNKKFGDIDPHASGIFEVTCNSKFCGQPNNVTLHIFNLGKVDEDNVIRPTETKWLKRFIEGENK